MKLFNNESQILLKRSLDLLIRHNKNISENVSNINVEGYKRKPTRFLDELVKAGTKRELSITHPRHLHFRDENRDVPEYEKGKVEITREMTDLAQNQIRFDFSARMMRRKFEGLAQAISGRVR